MKSNRKFKMIVGMLCVVVLSMFFMVGCNASKKQNVFKIGYANNDDSRFFDKYVRDEFEKLINADQSMEVQFANAVSDIQKQVDQIENFIAQKVNAIIITPEDADGIVPPIIKANELNIPVICITMNAADGDYIFVGTRYYDAGAGQGKYMAKVLPPNAKIVYLMGVPGQSHTRERRAGFFDLLKESGRSDVILLAEQPGNYERARGMQIMEDWIQAFPEIDAVISANDQMVLGAIEALKAANRLTGVLTAGVDTIPEAAQAIKNGEMTMSIYQSAPALAKGAYDTLKKIQNGETISKEVIIQQDIVSVENIDEYL
jgi:inositol transport system substrate-binding protein